MARKIKAGTICINNHNYGDPAWPFGGYKQSGWGREMGKEVMEHYTETRRSRRSSERRPRRGLRPCRQCVPTCGGLG